MSSIFRNLYKAQKLLSIDIDLELPIFKTEQLSNATFNEEFDLLPIAAVVFIILGALFVIYKYYRFRKKPRRRRKAKFMRLVSAINIKRVPTV